MHGVRTWLAQTHWKCQPGQKVVDFGCGTAAVLSHLPKDVSYVGLDADEGYLALARKRWKKRARFVDGTPQDLDAGRVEALDGADLVMCNGLLHHLDDEEARHALQLAKRILSPSGKLVCYEPVWLPEQGRVARWVMSLDRGRHIRHTEQWRDLVASVFTRFSMTVERGLLRIPYDHVIIECRNA
jgi:SAM-dependent methyltransferase